MVRCDVQPMPEIERNGKDFKYIVTYQRLDQENAQEHVAIVQNADAWHYVVPGRTFGIYKPFRITVKANNERGDSIADVNEVIGYSGEDGQTQLATFTYVLINHYPCLINIIFCYSLSTLYIITLALAGIRTAWGRGTPFRLFSSLSFHFLIFCFFKFSFFLFSFPLPILFFCPSLPFLPESSVRPALFPGRRM